MTQTVKRAKQKEKVTDGLMLHSDQETPYTSQAYPVLVSQYNITPSISRCGNGWDNAPIQTFFGHVKQTTFKDTEQLIDEYIYVYNYERIQFKTRQTPFETRCLSV